MKTIYLGIIGGLMVTISFTLYAALGQMTDSYYNKATTSPTEDLMTRIGGNATGIYYPLYDLSELPQVLEAKKTYPVVPFNVNINPASGPGTGPSTALASAITQLKSAGVVVTGYVPTGYGTRSVADVEGMIYAYNQFYPNMLDGIMLDEVSGSPSQFTFYQTITNYTRSLGYSYIRANPGSPIYQNDVPLFDQIAIYESSGYPSESILKSRTYYPQYSKAIVGFGATIHSQPTYDFTWLLMAKNYLKWVYITDQTEPNPYAVFPLYFNKYLGDLSSLDIVPTMKNLITIVKSMNLEEGETTSLDSKIQAAIDSFVSTNSTETKNQLNSFINEVNSQEGKKIDSSQALELKQVALNIINSIH